VKNRLLLAHSLSTDRQDAQLLLQLMVGDLLHTIAIPGLSRMSVWAAKSHEDHFELNAE